MAAVLCLRANRNAPPPETRTPPIATGTAHATVAVEDSEEDVDSSEDVDSEEDVVSEEDVDSPCS